MKYFHCVIPSNADHPEGKFVTETYVAATSKAGAKFRVGMGPLPAKPLFGSVPLETKTRTKNASPLNLTARRAAD